MENMRSGDLFDAAHYASVQADQARAKAIAGLCVAPAGKVADGRLPGLHERRNRLLRETRRLQLGDQRLEVHSTQYNVRTFTRKDGIPSGHNEIPTTTHTSAMKTVGERLRYARTRKKLTQKTLAKLAQTTQGAISDLEVGRNETSRDLPQYATILGVSALWLATGNGPMEADTSVDSIHGVTPSKQIASDFFVRCHHAAQLFCAKTGRLDTPPDDVIVLACRLYEQQADHPERGVSELLAYLMNISGMLKLL